MSILRYWFWAPRLFFFHLRILEAVKGCSCSELFYVPGGRQVVRDALYLGRNNIADRQSMFKKDGSWQQIPYVQGGRQLERETHCTIKRHLERNANVQIGWQLVSILYVLQLFSQTAGLIQRSSVDSWIVAKFVSPMEASTKEMGKYLWRTAT